MAELAMADRDYAPPRALGYPGEYPGERARDGRSAGHSTSRLSSRTMARNAGGVSARAAGGPRLAVAIASTLLAIAAAAGVAAFDDAPDVFPNRATLRLIYASAGVKPLTATLGVRVDF